MKPSQTFLEQIELMNATGADMSPNAIIQGVLLGLLDDLSEENQSLKRALVLMGRGGIILVQNAGALSKDDFEWLSQFLTQDNET